MSLVFLAPVRILKSGGLLAPLTAKQPEVGHRLLVKIDETEYSLRVTGVEPCPADLNTVDPEVIVGYGLTDHRDMHPLWLQTFPAVKPMLVRYFCPEGAFLAEFQEQNASSVKVAAPVEIPPSPATLPAYAIMTARETPCNLETLLNSMVRAVRQLNNILGHYNTINGSTSRALENALQVPEALRAQIEYLYELAIKVDEVRAEKEPS